MTYWYIGPYVCLPSSRLFGSKFVDLDLGYKAFVQSSTLILIVDITDDDMAVVVHFPDSTYQDELSWII